MALSGKSISKVFLRMRRGEKPVNIEVTEPIQVEALDLDAQGIARLAPNAEEVEEGHSGKVIFIQGALPTERVTYIITRDKARFSKDKVLKILNLQYLELSPNVKPLVCAVVAPCSTWIFVHK